MSNTKTGPDEAQVNELKNKIENLESEIDQRMLKLKEEVESSKSSLTHTLEKKIKGLAKKTQIETKEQDEKWRKQIDQIIS